MLRRVELRRILPPVLRVGWGVVVVGAILMMGGWRGEGATVADGRKALATGEYGKAVELAEDELEDNARDEGWHRVRVEGLLAQGKYPEADAACSNALVRVPRSVTLRWLARDAFSMNGRPRQAREAVAEIPQLVSRSPWAYREAADLVVVGRALLAAGADPKEVLERIYAVAKKGAPDQREAPLAAGELALDKGDFALAAKQFDEALKRFPDDADLHYGRARAFADSDRKVMGEALEAALKANPKHAPSWLLLADHRIDAEDYDGAREALKEVRGFNPAHPEVWAYEAVIAHLRSDQEAEEQARRKALEPWPTNPRVPHLMGQKLSQKYRFAEGAELQREALRFEAGYLPAKAQLASDLLRLGEDASGWEMVQEVHAADGYDVAAYNLATLFDTMKAFVTLTNAHFTVRMHARESAIYGERVMALLERARLALATKYGLELTQTTIVEIFPESKDFGVRTFGMPDNPGYLGVCFGRVITANSPASTRNKSVNWEAVLWHEFCHVVTLQLTANRMPRWLSEGISVYEERLADPAWGEQLNPSHREMILEGELTPVSKLSAAFLTPKTPQHLQFAYYQSSLVVEYLVAKYGLESLRAVLKDLREGVFINDTLGKRAVAMEDLEQGFAAFAREKALAMGRGLTWDRPKRPGGRGRAGDEEEAGATPGVRAALPEVLGGGTNYWALMNTARRHVMAGRWDDALPLLQQSLAIYPEQTGAESAHPLLVQVHRRRGDATSERQALERWAAMDAEAVDAYARLMELGAAAAEWGMVTTNAERYLAVDPLVALPYRYLSQAREAGGDRRGAVAASRTLLRLDPANPSEVHYRLAQLLVRDDPAGAKRHVLQALADVPRHRAALALLRELASKNPPPTPAESPASPVPAREPGRSDVR
ncbi:MAG: tetratricopeptide repeat protein [Verrucomicrobiales bacterium]|nr:tetratricopeptide repeat protein [Verrucomicrobiales bacterium]